MMYGLSSSLPARSLPFPRAPPPPPPPPLGQFVASPLVNNGCADPLNPAPCIRMVMNTRVGIFATTALVLYDYITSLDAEITFVWMYKNNQGRRWDLCRVTYLGIRYLTVLSFLFKSLLVFVHVPSQTCSALGMIDLTLAILIMILISAILASRNWALYNKKWYWLLFIVVFHGAIWTPALLVSFRGTDVYDVDLKAFRASQEAVAHDEVQSWLLGGCYITGCSDAYMWWGISTLITETVMWAMTAFKLRKSYSMSRLASNISRDGTIYYVVMFLALVAGAVSASSVAVPGSRAFVGSAYFVGIRAVACEHTIVRLRGYLATDIIVGTNLRTESDTLSPPAWQSRPPNVTNASFRFAPTPENGHSQSYLDEKRLGKMRCPADVEASFGATSVMMYEPEPGTFGSVPSSSAS